MTLRSTKLCHWTATIKATVLDGGPTACAKQRKAKSNKGNRDRERQHGPDVFSKAFYAWWFMWLAGEPPLNEDLNGKIHKWS